LLVCLRARAYREARPKARNHRDSVLPPPHSLFPSLSVPSPLAPLATLECNGETIGDPVKLASSSGRDKTSTCKRDLPPSPSAVILPGCPAAWALLSDFHKADQRPSVVKKQAHAKLGPPMVLGTFRYARFGLPPSPGSPEPALLRTRVHRLPASATDIPYINCLLLTRGECHERPV